MGRQNLMIALLLGYWRVGLIGAVILGGWYWHSRQVTQSYERGVASGQQQLFDEQIKALEVREMESRAALDQRESEVNASAEQLTIERRRLDQVGSSINTTLNRRLDSIRNQSMENRNVSATIGDDALLPAIRAVLSELSSIERGRSQPATPVIN